jgi:hypothetical protein
MEHMNAPCEKSTTQYVFVQSPWFSVCSERRNGQNFSFDVKAGPIPKSRKHRCLEDPVEAVLFTRSTLLALVKVDNPQSY